ncbi:preprotein translocase subunit SecE [Candidatus Phytoplasma sacchari]|uniref:Preprotein translocase subunit SecE n=1 Tax=Candidatus Phytoplasma sacchari TaxID=2609813 RepID=A0ABY7M378_9MOLU|nr:preprotein translocase subunit SecE [Candidatus Phytoplasma sacchari]
MVYKNKEEKNKIPLLEVIKKEYSLFRIFLVIFSVLFIGIFQNIRYSYLSNKNRYNFYFYFYFYFGFFSFVCFFIYGIFPFITKIVKENYLVSWPSYKNVFLKFIQVLIFTIILECVIYFFSYLYEKFDPVLVYIKSS